MFWLLRSDDEATAHRIKQEFVTALIEFGGDEQDYFESELIFGELLGNVVRHAPGRAFVTLEFTGNIAVLCVHDEGSGFRPAAVLPSADSESGRGLYIVSQLSQAVVVNTDPEGTSVCATLPVTRKKPVCKPASQ
ncbi:MAG: ATP-binding protein [Vulcanimicrobiaceae bacterium]